MLKLTELSRSILLKRGIHDHHAWVEPSPAQLAEPAHFPGMEDRAHWWINSLKSSKPILLFGDYDVDGITSCAIAAKYFRELGLPTRAFIPSRLQDGYGLTGQVLEKFELSQYSAALIMDSGTTAPVALEKLNKANLPTLVIDHHAPDSSTKEYNYARIINPRIWGGGYPCSAMLVYHFCACVDRSRLHPEMLGLAALAGIADSVPMDLENHTFIKLGLPSLAQCPAMKIMGKNLDFGLVTRELASWQIAPRINAAGRMGNAALALDFLLQPSQAGFQALEQVNQERRKLQETILADAEQQASDQRNQGIIFVHGPWHPGVLGIVASKLVERYHRPAIVVAESELCQGSGRSPAGTDLLGLLRSTSLPTDWYGGHSAAIGMRMPLRLLPEVKQQLTSIPPSATNYPFAPVEVIISTAEVNRNEAYAIDCLEPFGPSFPAPILGIEGVLEESNGQWQVKDTEGTCPALNPHNHYPSGNTVAFHMTLTSRGTTARILPS
jgi:single-stranded-DNA-specific exonuclease